MPTTTELKNSLGLRFESKRWCDTLRYLFPQAALLEFPEPIAKKHEAIKSWVQTGAVRLKDGKSVVFFEIEVNDKVQIARNRVELRNLVAATIDQQTCHGVLAVFYGDTPDYRLTFAARDAHWVEGEGLEVHETAAKRFSFLLGAREPCTTAAQRLTSVAEQSHKGELDLDRLLLAFSVERLNKEFFDGYKLIYNRFVAHLQEQPLARKAFAVPSDADPVKQAELDKPLRDAAKRLLGRILFLYFVQKKGWLAHDLNFVRNQFDAWSQKECFHSQFLVKLFHEALNLDGRPQEMFPVTNSWIPYLNGGLFEEKHPQARQLDFPAQLFADLFEFLGRYNFTIDENDPDEREVGIDPEMLGHIFENLLEDNKDKGAYYTPKAVVQYMCQQSLLRYLESKVGAHEELTQLVVYKITNHSHTHSWLRGKAKEIEAALEAVRICDPAIGSGAFPIGMLQEIYWIRMELDMTLDPFETKRRIIQDCIYGVDKDAGAVEIARLRFWLALVVDEQKPSPLPNLEYKIMQGDSLLESFQGIALDKLQGSATGPEQGTLWKSDKGSATTMLDLGFDHQMELSTADKIKLQEALQNYYGTTDAVRKQALHREIDQLVLGHLDFNIERAILQLQEEETRLKKSHADKRKQLPNWVASAKEQKRLLTLQAELQERKQQRQSLRQCETSHERPYFLWHLYFEKVFAQGGFDIVIANPPYVRQESLKGYKEWLTDYTCGGGTADLFVYFYEQGVRLLKAGGVLCYISSNKYFRAGYGKMLRKHLTTQLRLDQLIDFNDYPVFNGIIAYASILIAQKRAQGQGLAPEHRVATLQWPHDSKPPQLLNLIRERSVPLRQSDLRPDGWQLDSKDRLELLDKLRQGGTPLGEYVKDRFYYGIKTGLNEAFVVDKATRDRLVAEDPGCEPLLKPFLRGRDVKRWKVDYRGLWLIFTRHGTDIDQYPSVKKHLQQFRAQLEPKPANWPEAKDWLGRKPGPYQWFEIQDNIAYYPEFDQQKIVYQEICTHQAFAMCEPGMYMNNKLFMLPGQSYHFLSLFNSKVSWWYLTKTATAMVGGAYALQSPYISAIPIPATTDADRLTLESLAKQAEQAVGDSLERIEQQINAIVYRLFHLTEVEVALIEKDLGRIASVDASAEPTTTVENAKADLFSKVLPGLVSQAPYVSYESIIAAVAQAGLDIKLSVLKVYLHQAVQQGVIGDAGRGWYTGLKQKFAWNLDPVQSIVDILNHEFPLLENRAVWSTQQFYPFMQHLLNQHLIFVSVPRDAIGAVAAFLENVGYTVHPNPGKPLVHLIKPGDKVVVIRPSLSRQPVDTENPGYAHPVKAMVDLLVEAKNLEFIDLSEAWLWIERMLNSGWVDIEILLNNLKSRDVEFANQLTSAGNFKKSVGVN